MQPRSYKRYNEHESTLEIPKRTQRYWNSKIKNDKSQRSCSERLSNCHPEKTSTQDISKDPDERFDDIPQEVSEKTLTQDISKDPDERFDDIPQEVSENSSELSSAINSTESSGIQQAKQCTREFPMPVLIRTLLSMATKLRHNSTYAAVDDFLNVFFLLTDLPEAQASKYYWKQILSKYSTCLEVHHICSECQLYVGKQTNNPLRCNSCGEVIDTKSNLNSNNAFLHIPLTYQLKEIFELMGAHHLFSERRKKLCEYAIEDIFDGRMYKKNASKDMISINFSVDGAPVFDSSNFSIWPVLCTINELEPKERNNNVLLTSLWFGRGKPTINEYLKPFVIECQQLFAEGFTYTFEGTVYTKKCRVLVGVCDSVARPMVRNSTQFNGNYGCGLCLHSGKTVPKGNGITRVYPLDEDHNPFGEGLRKHDDTLQHADRKQKGMKGRSVVCDIPDFNIVNGLDVDWMHCVALGVCRQIANLHFNSKYSNAEFYFGHLIDDVDKLLLSLHPSSDISRTPRIMSDRCHWKAHEWVIFLLFYSLPIFQVLFPKKYVLHWSLLVDAISVLLKKSIMPSEIAMAHTCLVYFIEGVQELYGEEHVSFNVHLLAHCGSSVQNWGPLWTHSAFAYENANQDLLNYVHSSNGVALQICDTFRTKCAVDRLRLVCSRKLTDSQKEYLDRVLNKRTRPKPSLIHQNGCMLGTGLMLKNLPRDQYLAFQRVNIDVQQQTNIQCFSRAIINKQVICSKEYQRFQKRRNYYVLLRNGEVFEIESFLVLQVGNDFSPYAIGKYFEKENKPLIKDRRLEHLILLKKCTENLAVIDTSMIIEKVTVIQVHNLEIACVHPNHCELLT